MQKTKLGVSVGMMGAALCLSCAFGGYLISLLLLGYILLFEENMWLKKNSVKAVATLFGFSVLTTVIGIIPGFIGIIDSVLGIFGGNLYIGFISEIFSTLSRVVDFVETLVFLGLGLKALNQGTLKIPVIDSMVSKYMD